ncbi:MAG: 3-hydroxyacyl-CoA dehydrogenase family protein [Pseudomonadota bacterium]
MKIEKATVVGAGIMGHGVAQLLAQNGIRVDLVDINPEYLERARGLIRDNLDFMVKLGELVPDAVEGILNRINVGTDLTACLPGAGYVLEAVSENFDLKRRVWSRLSQDAPADCILASNTSSYDINELAEGVKGQERIVGTHWFHPPQITPCVEVIPGDGASAENIQWTVDFLESLGKVPTVCKSAPGFVANRIQMAMAREAIALVEEGLATPQEVDRVVKTSFGFRLGAYGPFEIMDQAGADTYLSVFEYLFSKLPRDHFRPPPLLQKQVAAGRLGLKSSQGFYDYGPDAADAIRRDRDRKFYSRLNLVKSEWEDER